MKQTTHRTTAWIGASAVILGLAAPLTLAAPASATAPGSALHWTECRTAAPGPRQQCATVKVPLDYAAPAGRKVDIVVSRVRAEKPAARRGALLLIPGGPGNTSLDDTSGKGQRLPQEVRDAYDLIGFAPRGLAPSTSVDCGLDHGDLAVSKLRPWPAADGSITENMVTARRVAEACTQNGGELMRHITTVDEARDIDRIRVALGEDRLSAWGVSYGTYVGAVYSQLFPHRTDRVVLDSNDDPDPTRVSRAWLAGYETGVEDTFPEFAAWAAAPGNPDRLAETAAEVRPLFLRLAAQLDRRPIPWPDANPEALDGNVLRQTMLDSFYAPGTRFPALAKLMRAALDGTVPPAPTAPPEDVQQNIAAVSVATLCNDVTWPSSASAYRTAVAESRKEHPLTAGMPRNAIVCAAWPHPPRQAPVRITDQGPSNVLLIQNARDVATPLSGALKLRTALGRRAVLVTVNSTGHDAYLANGNACGDRTVSHFLSTGQRPARDTYCA
ncbi:alpha/beta hydrolase [Streptomyces sp. SID2888]|uniref:alpha/beta hydrolase n=1 Tax=Streptomyces sp. SID2888 TaxID=2690256 RepID=UPI00136CA195|nr:alpha/beta hydrolase [Streptomyces sp. SID2888]MYV49670.1 alpha/beta fold hydrolase [Streptomyces sp. SID2888]